jgi:hypothetical protein
MSLHKYCAYTQRVVQKAVETVYHDGLAMRCVPLPGAGCLGKARREDGAPVVPRLRRRDRLRDYQPWAIANFSGILCVDEVYQGDLALLLAVDPAAPDGDRLVGYTLLPKTREVD